MELSLFAVFCVAILLMIVVFFAFFAWKASSVYHDLSQNFGRILGGSLVAGIGSGVLLALLLLALLPTYHYVVASTTKGVTTRYVINGSFFEEYGRKYVVNYTEERIYLVAMTYGDKELSEEDFLITILEPEYITQIDHSVDQWFKAFPQTVSTKNKGEIKWHVLTKSQTLQEMREIDVDINPEEL